MNLLTIVLPLLINSMGFQPDKKKKKNANDGPYVLYKKGQIEVRSIVLEDGLRKAKLETYPAGKKAGLPLKVQFSNHPKWDFTVKLQPVLKMEPSETKQPDRIIVLSDIEGEFEAFRKLLLANKVMDEQYDWIFGKGHLVICGDLFDRGKEVPATLWLLYKLEQDAKAKGGYLHTILGNHDIMNLSGDLRYVESKYFEMQS